MPGKPTRHVTRRNSKKQLRSNGMDKYLSYERLEPRQLLAALPIITEFSASNQSVIFDGNGASPDWIEVFNDGDQSIDLAGYSLTDDPEALNKWVFPNQTLDAGEYLVVFASGDAIPDPSGNLHTNFSLSAGGDYLALSDPSGTVLSEFGSSTTDFPPQQGDESYGLAFNSTVTDVVTPTSSAQYFIPTDASVDAFWTSNGFDDSAWQTGSASIGYEENPADFDDLIITRVPLGTTSLYSRITFEVTDPDTLLSTLQMRYDDGFIAYLNGTRIASDNAPAVGAYNSLATGQHADRLAVNFVDFDISAFSDSLVVGTNTLAIHLLNRNSDSSDFLSVPNLITTAGNLISPAIEGQLVSPTPGQPNTNVTASPVAFSHVGGTFFNAFQLELTSSEPNETIRFTLDGSQPTASSALYTGPIVLNASAQVRARAFGPLGQEGPIAVESFSLTDSATNSFTSDLPIIVIENYGAGDPGDGDFEPAALSLYDVDDISGRSSLSGDADVSTLIGQHRRGSSTLNNPKPNLRIETRDPLGEDQNVSWLGLPAESDWILTGPYRFDRALIRDTLLHDLSNQSGNYSVRTRFVEVYGNFDGGLLTNTDYLGVYFLTETVKIDDDRVDIASLDTSDNTEPDITGGYILRIDRGGQFETSRGVPNRGGASFVHVSPDPQELTSEQTAYIRGYVQDLEDALYGPNSTDPELGYEAFLDVEASIDHHIFRTLSLEPDSLGLSTFLTKDRNGKLAFGPIWDFDRSQGSDVDLRSSDPEVWFSGVDFFEFDWWGELFNDPDFKQQWVDRWQELRQTTFSDANILATLNGQASELGEAQARNFARWPEVAPNGGEFAAPGLTGWEAEVSHLAGWLMTRLDWIDSRLVSAPTLGTNPGNVSAGSQITLVSDQPGAAIFYTLDGTDPRADGGGLSSSAILYTGPLTVSATTQVIFRALDTPTESVGQTPGTSPWSQAVEGLFSVEAPASSANLAVSELHYHPVDPTATELLDVPGTDEDDFEFIELINVSNDAISLNGVTLQDAVSFDFTSAAIRSLAPGETVLVVNNIDAFEARYGTGFAIAGEYSGRFSDNSERVLVVDSLDQAIHDFTYSDSNPWPVEADGDGPSLELIDVNGDHSDPVNWRLSATDGGTPGVAPADVAPQVVSLVRDGGSIARPDLLGTVAFTFSQDVNVDAANLTVQNDTLGGLPFDTSSVGFSYDSATRSATWDFGSLVLDAAFYTFRLSSNITGVAGGLALDGNGDGVGGDNRSESVYVAIPGDRNLDGVVDSVDVNVTIGNVGTTQGAVWADGDFNGDGAVEVIADVLTMTGNLNKSVVPPASPIQFNDEGSEVTELATIPDEAQTFSDELDVEVADEADDLVPLDVTAHPPALLTEDILVVPTEVVSFQSDDGPIEVEDVELPLVENEAQTLIEDVADEVDDQVLPNETAITPVQVVEVTSVVAATEDALQIDDGPVEVEEIELPFVASEIQSPIVEFNVDATVEADDLVLLEHTTNMPASLVAAAFTYQPTSFQSTLSAALSAVDDQTSILAGSVADRDSDQNLLHDYSDEFYLALADDANLDSIVDGIDDVLGNLDGIDTVGSSVAIDEVFAQLDV